MYFVYQVSTFNLTSIWGPPGAREAQIAKGEVKSPGLEEEQKKLPYLIIIASTRETEENSHAC